MAGALDDAAQHRKGRVVRAQHKLWSRFLLLLDAAQEPEDVVRAKLSDELFALILASREGRS